MDAPQCYVTKPDLPSANDMKMIPRGSKHVAG